MRHVGVRLLRFSDPNPNPNPSPNPSPNPNPNPNQVMAVTAGRDVHAAVDAIRASDAREISAMSRQVDALQARLSSAKKEKARLHEGSSGAGAAPLTLTLTLALALALALTLALPLTLTLTLALTLTPTRRGGGQPGGAAQDGSGPRRAGEEHVRPCNVP